MRSLFWAPTCLVRALYEVHLLRNFLYLLFILTLPCKITSRLWPFSVKYLVALQNTFYVDTYGSPSFCLSFTSSQVYEIQFTNTYVVLTFCIFLQNVWSNWNSCYCFPQEIDFLLKEMGLHSFIYLISLTSKVLIWDINTIILLYIF